MRLIGIFGGRKEENCGKENRHIAGSGCVMRCVRVLFRGVRGGNGRQSDGFFLFGEFFRSVGAYRYVRTGRQGGYRENGEGGRKPYGYSRTRFRKRLYDRLGQDGLFFRNGKHNGYDDKNAQRIYNYV